MRQQLIFPGLWMVLFLVVFASCSKGNPDPTGNYTCLCSQVLNNIVIDTVSKKYNNMPLIAAADSCAQYQKKAFHGAAASVATTTCNFDSYTGNKL